MQRCVVWCVVCDTPGLCGVGWGVYCFLLLPVGVCFLCGGVFLVCGGGLRTQERVLYYFYAYMFCKLWSD